MDTQRGSIASIVLAGVSLVTIVGAVVGLALQNSVTTTTQARVVNSPVRLVKGTAGGQRINDRIVRLYGDFCYTRYLQSGGVESWTMYPTDERNQILRTSAGSSKHIDQGQVTVSPANGDFPALCKTVNEETGEAEWIARNTDNMQPHTFSFEAYLPEKLVGGYCPDVYVHYRGTWMEGLPFARISLKDIPGICEPPATPVPSATTTPLPTQTPATPTPSPSPTPSAITGAISVYGCKKPEDMKLFVCKDDNCSASASIPFNQTQEKLPVNQGIWLEDSNQDRTWIYRYNITADAEGRSLDPEKNYRLKIAQAFFDNGVKIIDSKAEDLDKLALRVGNARDFEIYADQTCDCNIYAEAYIKDKNGNIITELDEKAGYGIANNNQVFDAGRKLAGLFRNGRVVIGPGDLFSLYNPTRYGRNTSAHIRLFAPGWKVLRQECTSTGTFPACPMRENSFEKDASELARPELFEYIGVGCGENVKYGWVIEKKPTPTPVPANTDDDSPSGPQQGNGHLVTHTVFYDRQQNPPSCDATQIDPQVGYDPTESLYSHFTWRHTVEISGSVTRSDPDGSTYAHQRFNELPAGRYSIRIKPGTDDRMQYMQLASNCPTSVEVKPGQTTNALLVVYVRRGSSYQVGDEVGNTCRNCQLTQGTCGPAIAGRVLCLNPGTYTPPDDEENGSTSPGDYKSFNMIVMDADNPTSAQCYGAANGKGNPINNHGTYDDKGIACAYQAEQTRDGIVKKLKVTLINKTRAAAKDVSTLLSPKESTRVMWQIHRCKDQNKFPCQGEANDEKDYMSEARTWWCVQPGQSLECSWDVTKWKENSFVQCSLNGRDVTNDRSTCRYSNDFASLEDITTEDLQKIDVDQNNVVNVADITYILDNYGRSGSDIEQLDDMRSPDVNSDGIVNSSDYTMLIKYIGTQVP